MFATILVPTSGTARVAGFDIRKEPEKARGSLGFLSVATASMGVSPRWRWSNTWACGLDAARASDRRGSLTSSCESINRPDALAMP